jgi:GNAT superfamily N-acetyltransferase
MIQSEDIAIRRATAAEIRSLRHRVLRSGLPIEAADFDNDDHPTTFHAAAIADTRVIGCATIMMSTFENQPAWRLRGMAVDPAFHRRGIGSRLLSACEAHAIRHGPTLFWCNARTPAVPFYQAQHWTRHGDEFDIPTAGPHYRMSKHL